MNWDEFCDLLNGLNEQTPLCKVIQIRKETDPAVVKGFTAGQKQIRSDWQKRQAMQKTQEETDQFLEAIQKGFKELAMKGD